MLNLEDVNFYPSQKTDREIKIIQYIQNKKQEIEIKKAEWSTEWRIMEDKVFIKNKKRQYNNDYDTFNDDYGSNLSDWRTHVAFPLPISILKKQVADFLRNYPKYVIRTLDIKNYANLKFFEKIFDWQNEMAKLSTQLLYTYIDSKVKGIGFLEIGYLEKYKTIKDVDFDGTRKISPANIKTTNEKKILDYDGIFYKRLDPDNIWIDPNAVDISSHVNGARYIIIKDLIDFETFRNDFMDFKNSMAVVPTTSNIDPFNFNTETKGTDIQGNYVHLFRYYDQINDECFFVANEEVIYDGPIIYAHKRLPVIQLKNVPYPGNLYVPGDTSIIEHSDEVRNVAMNLSIDNSKSALQPHVFISDPDIDPDEVKLQPGGVTLVRRGFDLRESLQVHQPQDTSQSAFSMIDLSEREIIRATGVDVNAQFPPPNEKVTQTALKKELSNIMFNLYIKYNSANGIKDMYQIAMSNIMQFLPQKKVRHYLSPEGIYKEKLSYPQVTIEDSRKIIKKKKKQGKEIDEIHLIPKKGEVVMLEATPEIVRQQLLVNVKDSELTLDMEVLELERFQQFIQLILSDPEMRAMADKEVLFNELMRKYKQDPEKVRNKTEVKENKEIISEPEKELRNIRLGLTYDEPKDIIHYEHAQFMKKFILTKDYKNETGEIQQAIQQAMVKHLSKSLDTENSQQQKQTDNEELLRQQMIEQNKRNKVNTSRLNVIETAQKKTAQEQAQSMAQQITSNVLPQR